jgi:hypothetical protein
MHQGRFREFAEGPRDSERRSLELRVAFAIQFQILAIYSMPKRTQIRHLRHPTWFIHEVRVRPQRVPFLFVLIRLKVDRQHDLRFSVSFPML